MGLWDLEDGTHIRDFLGHADHVKRVLFLDEDSTFVSGSGDGMIRLWSRTVEEPTRILRGHTHSIARMISHDNLLISGSHDNTVRIWDLATGDCIRVLEGQPIYVSTLMFSTDYSLLYAGCGNAEVYIWNWRDGKLVAVCQTEAKSHSQFSNIDLNLVTCGSDGVIRIWTQEGSLIKTFAAHETPVRALVKIGRFAVTGGREGRLKVWDWDNKEWLFDLRDDQDPGSLVRWLITAYGKLAVVSWEKSGLNHIQIWELDEIQEAALKYISREKPL